MDTHSYLEILVTDRLGGDKSRVVELFDDNEVYRNLVVLDVTGGWLNYKNNLNDGWHLIEHFGFYDVYYQERGAILERSRFEKLKEAAAFFYTESGYVGS